MSEKIEKVIDITKYKLGDLVKDVKCPKCKDREMRLSGLYRRNTKSHELECYSCCYSEKVIPTNVEFTYEPPKEPKKKKGEVES
jgi:Zn ribbon nucleic-acid-binding protein